MAADETDWRLQGQEKYLLGVRLTRRTWHQTQAGWDHDHCEFCSAEFSDERYPNALHEGWTTSDEYRWICERCFADFRERFGWKVATDEP